MASKRLSMVVSGSMMAAIASSAFAGGHLAECYEHYRRPALYDSFVQDQLVTPAEITFETMPAQYERQQRAVRVAPETAYYDEVPAQYATVLKKVLVPGYTVARAIPAVTETRYRTVTVPGGYAWEWRVVHGRKVLCKVWRKASTRRIAETVVVRPERVVHEKAPAQYVYQDQKVLISPARTQKIVRPAEYRYEDDLVMVRPEGRVPVEVPAQYETVSRKVLVREGASGWRRVAARNYCQD